jgi:hypothetical protein
MQQMEGYSVDPAIYGDTRKGFVTKRKDRRKNWCEL